MPTWPGTLPQSPQTEGYSEMLPENLIRTQMDAGPAKVRRRSTVNVRRFTVLYKLTGAQVTTLDDFVMSDIAGGSTAFDYPDPRTGTTISVRLVTMPKIAAMGGDEYNVTFDLERLP